MSDDANRPGVPHPDVGPLIEAIRIVDGIPHTEEIGCIVIIFRGRKMRLVMDDSLDHLEVAKAFQEIAETIRSQPGEEVDPDTPLGQKLQ